jgi:Lrp/AsnC family leucine-responsive transcriptional regulator
MEKLDNTDKKILESLQTDCTLNTKEVAAKVGLSVTATYERIKRMEKTGMIDGYVALINKDKIGKSLVAFCSVSLQLHSKPLLNKFEKAILDLSEVMECFHTAGTSDYLLKIVVDDMKHYQDVITNKLAVIENIAQVHSSFVMTEVKYETAFRLN